MQRAGVRQKDIARALRVGKWHVSHVLAGRAISEPVLRKAEELVAAASREPQERDE